MANDGFTGTGPGGDIMKVDLNEQFDKADMVWVGVSAALVWLMVPGVGLLYSGLSRKEACIVVIMGLAYGHLLDCLSVVLLGVLISFHKK